MDIQKKIYIGKTAIWTAFLILIVLIAYNLQAGNFKGETGEKGQTIIGPAGHDGQPGLNGRDGINGLNGTDGRDGSNGRNGRDAPVNHPPIITLLDLSGYKNCYVFNLTYSVSDQDDDDLQISVFSGSTENTLMLYVTQFGAGDHTVQCRTHSRTNQWVIVAWDGSDLTQLAETYTVSG
jgi:hypothetical protein